MVEMAFEQARERTKIIEYNPNYRYRDFTYRISFVEEEYNVKIEIRVN